MKVHDKDDWDAFGQAMAFTNATGMDNQFMGYYQMAKESSTKEDEPLTEEEKEEIERYRPLAWKILWVLVALAFIYLISQMVEMLS